MFSCSPLLSVVFAAFAVLSPLRLCAQALADSPEPSDADVDTPYERTVDFTLRLGMGGFRDSRTPVGSLGGDQLAIDIKPRAWPVALSVSSEYYTNSPEPTHAYEISNLIAINLLYVAHAVSNERLNYFFGGGIGWLEVPSDINNPGAREKDNLFNLEAGVRYCYFERFGFYGAVKYLTAEKTVNNIKLIDFNERVFLVGITYNFSL